MGSKSWLERLFTPRSISGFVQDIRRTKSDLDVGGKRTPSQEYGNCISVATQCQSERSTRLASECSETVSLRETVTQLQLELSRMQNRLEDSERKIEVLQA